MLETIGKLQGILVVFLGERRSNRSLSARREAGAFWEEYDAFSRSKIMRQCLNLPKRIVALLTIDKDIWQSMADDIKAWVPQQFTFHYEPKRATLELRDEFSRDKAVSTADVPA